MNRWFQDTSRFLLLFNPSSPNHSELAGMAADTEGLSQTLGVLLLGMGVAMGLYGLTCAQTFWYYQTYSEGDAKWIKALTGYLWLLNTAHTAAVMHIPYFYLVTAAEDPALKNVTTWSLPISSVILAFVSFSVYNFYIWRLWTLRRNVILCSALTILCLGHFIATFTFGIRGLTIDRTMQDYFGTHSLISLKIATCFGTSTDVLAALSMCWSLYKSRTGYQNTDSAINMIIAYTINTGLVAALCVLCSLIALVVWPQSYVSLFFLFLIAPLETNSYMGSLNARSYFSRHSQRKGNPVGLSGLTGAGGSPQLEIRVDRTLDTYRLEASPTRTDKDSYSVKLGV